jgi:hypothetical protein
MPLLFNLVADALGVMLQTTINKGHIIGVLTELNSGNFTYGIC